MSFFHGSNDGQKGMGLIMLILIGTVPTAYALNRAMPESQMRTFAPDFAGRERGDRAEGAGYNVLGNPRPAVTAYVASHADQRGHLSVAGRPGARHLRPGHANTGRLRKLPADAVGNTRNDMYLASEAIRFLMKDKASDSVGGRNQNAERL